MIYLMECGKKFETLEHALEHERSYGHKCVELVDDECEGKGAG